MNGGRKRLAIVGGGSSGLVTLKLALDALPEWKIVCFEKSDRITGCWGRPYPGFVSTSTKYTTQFASFPLFDATVNPDGGVSREEFFREDEYGQYLERFAEKFGLREHIELNTTVDLVQQNVSGAGWELMISPGNRVEYFDAVVLCTGLAAQPKRIESNVPTLSVSELNSPLGLNHVRCKRVVVIGGGESAVDYAVRLSQAELGNRVFLSLYTGIRVSPRYHPIRGLPSDFLRNRLMLSIHADLRNWIGQRFVESRIKYQERFERWFPPKQKLAVFSDCRQQSSDEQQVAQLRKHWAYVLTKAAKDELFNMFHNKSDEFLDAVARGAIKIVGQPLDQDFSSCKSFESDDAIEVGADLLVPAIGYRSTLGTISAGNICVRDFYMGCVHIKYSNLFLIGFARPIIGNIPTISELQARYACGLISGQVNRESEIVKLHQINAEQNRTQFANLNLDAIYPVEMFPYSDQLARLMGAYPSVRSIGSVLKWCREQLTPATTLHYFAHDTEARKCFTKSQVYMPLLLIWLLLMLKPADWVYRFAKHLCTAFKQGNVVFCGLFSLDTTIWFPA